MQPRLVHGELETLEHRRARIESLLEDQAISSEMRGQLAQVVRDIELRMTMLRRAQWQVSEPVRIAA